MQRGHASHPHPLGAMPWALPEKSLSSAWIKVRPPNLQKTVQELS